jgi:hypothetical protein
LIDGRRSKVNAVMTTENDGIDVPGEPMGIVYAAAAVFAA